MAHGMGSHQALEMSLNTEPQYGALAPSVSPHRPECAALRDARREHTNPALRLLAVRQRCALFSSRLLSSRQTPQECLIVCSREPSSLPCAWKALVACEQAGVKRCNNRLPGLEEVHDVS